MSLVGLGTPHKSRPIYSPNVSPRIHCVLYSLLRHLFFDDHPLILMIKLPIILEEFREYTSKLIKRNRKMSTCNWLASEPHMDLNQFTAQTSLPGYTVYCTHFFVICFWWSSSCFDEQVLCEVSFQWLPTSSSHMVKVDSASCLLQSSLVVLRGRPAVSSMAVLSD